MTNKFDEVTYTILTPQDFVPRECMRLNPKQELPRTRYFDLEHLRNDVAVNFVISNSDKNIRAAAWYSLYYQQAAYLEGWRFNAKNYRIFTAPVGLVTVDGEGRVFTFGSPYKEENNPRQLGLFVHSNGSTEKMRANEASHTQAMLEYIIAKAEERRAHSNRTGTILTVGTGLRLLK